MNLDEYFNTYINYLFGKTILNHSIINDEHKITHKSIECQRHLGDYLSEQTNDYNLTDWRTAEY